MKSAYYLREQRLLGTRSHWMKRLAACEDHTERLAICEKIVVIDEALLLYSEERRDSERWRIPWMESA